MDEKKEFRNIDEMKKEMFGFNEDDYKASYEIMVTITLHEYRDLVKSKALLSDANLRAYNAEDKLRKLELEIAEGKKNVGV